MHHGLRPPNKLVRQGESIEIGLYKRVKSRRSDLRFVRGKNIRLFEEDPHRQGRRGAVCAAQSALNHAPIAIVSTKKSNPLSQAQIKRHQGCSKIVLKVIIGLLRLSFDVLLILNCKSVSSRISACSCVHVCKASESVESRSRESISAPEKTQTI